jgi:ABC-type maltose transport system permease subunit
MRLQLAEAKAKLLTLEATVVQLHKESATREAAEQERLAALEVLPFFVMFVLSKKIFVSGSGTSRGARPDGCCEKRSRA